MQLWNKRCHELVRWMCVSIYVLQFYTKPNKINEGIVVSLISKGKHTREFRRHPSSQYLPSIIASIHVSAGNVAKWIDNCVSVHQYKMMNWERYTVNKTEFAENNIIFVNQKRLTTGKLYSKLSCNFEICDGIYTVFNTLTYC